MWQPSGRTSGRPAPLNLLIAWETELRPLSRVLPQANFCADATADEPAESDTIRTDIIFCVYVN